MMQKEDGVNVTTGEHKSLVEVVYLVSQRLLEAERHHARHTVVQAGQIAQRSINVSHLEPPLDGRLIQLNDHLVAISLKIGLHAAVRISLRRIWYLVTVKQQFQTYGYFRLVHGL